MKWQRLWQPQRLLFWQMLVFNILSSVCSYALRSLPLNATGTVIISLVALANVAFGFLAAWALLKDPAPGEVQSSAPGSSANTASTSE
jgi:hypothetical protein